MSSVGKIAILATVVSVVFVLAIAPLAKAADGLVGYWNFDETTGLQIIDSSENGNSGMLLGTAQRSTMLPPTTCFANTSSLQVDGSGAYAEIPDSPSMDPTNQITIAFWMNPDTVTNGYQHIVFKQGPVVTSYGVWLMDNHIYMEDNDDSVRSLTSNATISPGEWHYIAVTYDGNVQSLYIDGILDNSQSLPGISLSYMNSPVKVGAGDYNNSFAGYIDDLRIYEVALSATQIADLANGGCGPGVAAISQAGNATLDTPPSAILPPNTGIAPATSLARPTVLFAWLGSIALVLGFVGLRKLFRKSLS